MKSQGSVPYFQEPAIGLHPETDQSNPHSSILFLYDTF
jgi:hypothetical protein